MANKYAINTGALTWSGSSWNTASNQATSNTTAPTNADVAYLDQYSSNMTVNATTCVCKELRCSGYTKTLTFTSGQTLTVGGSGAGVIDFPSGAGGTVAGTGTLSLLTGTQAITSNGIVMTGSFIFNTNSSVTFTGDFQVNGALTYNGTNNFTGKLIFNGTSWTVGNKAQLNGGTVEFKSTFTLPTSCNLFSTTFNSGANTLTVPSSISFAKTVTYTSGTMDMTTNSSVASFATGSTIATNGITWYGATLNGTTTLTQNFNCTNLILGGNGLTESGAYTITCAQLRIGSSASLNQSASSTYTLAAGSAIVINTYLYLHGNAPFVLNFLSDTASSPAYFVYNGTRANCQVNFCTFTDISNVNGNRINALYSTVLRSPNIVQMRNSDLLGAGALISNFN